MSDPIQSAPTAVIQQEALRWLVCPVCRQCLAQESSIVRCSGCRRGYPVVDGIPVLLADRAI
ncbi:MAG: Trm112 family protein [Acidobacteriota bacterium]|nr:Trm112 family protein [Acidobacteriota bacterium]